MRTVYLVGCGATKRAEPCEAQHMYTGSLFRAASAYARREAELSPGGRWFILSAKHGLLLPDRVIHPYDCQLPKNLGPRLQWGADVAHQLLAAMGSACLHVVALAGETYCAPVREDLRRFAVALEAPLTGLFVGQRLQWFARQP